MRRNNFIFLFFLWWIKKIVSTVYFHQFLFKIPTPSLWIFIQLNLDRLYKVYLKFITVNYTFFTYLLFSVTKVAHLILVIIIIIIMRLFFLYIFRCWESLVWSVHNYEYSPGVFILCQGRSFDTHNTAMKFFLH